MIGLPDKIDGEVPIAVVKRTVPSHQDTTNQVLENVLVNRLGVEYAPREVIPLQALR